MSELCIIPCGNKKIWDKEGDIGPVKAEDAYIGTFHKLCEQYAKAFFKHWIILSAKHGFLHPKDMVPGNYDVTFNTGSKEIISIDDLVEQKYNKGLDQFTSIVVLTGKKYVPVVTSCFNSNQNITFPLIGSKGIGYMQRDLKQAIETDQPLHK